MLRMEYIKIFLKNNQSDEYLTGKFRMMFFYLIEENPV